MEDLIFTELKHLLIITQRIDQQAQMWNISITITSMLRIERKILNLKDPILKVTHSILNDNPKFKDMEI